MRRIACQDDVEAALDALAAADPRLAAIRSIAGPVPLRLAPSGFASLASIVVSQQVSRASADAIFGRLQSLCGTLTPQAVLSGGEDLMRRAGLSRPKQRTLLALAAGVEGGLDLEALALDDAAAAIAALTRVHGIGPWTAEVYLLSCAGHADMFPARDVALQTAAGLVLGIDPRPDARALQVVAESWAPHRSTAARLLWAFYATQRGRSGAPASAQA